MIVATSELIEFYEQKANANGFTRAVSHRQQHDHQAPYSKASSGNIWRSTFECTTSAQIRIRATTQHTRCGSNL